jgi:hypothetical protein
LSKGDAELTEYLAQVLCDAFWETCETKQTWGQTSQTQRTVFRLMAARTIEAARKFKQERTA